MPPDVFIDFTLEVITVNSLKMEYKFETVFFFFFFSPGLFRNKPNSLSM